MGLTGLEAGQLLHSWAPCPFIAVSQSPTCEEVAISVQLSLTSVLSSPQGSQGGQDGCMCNNVVWSHSAQYSHAHTHAVCNCIEW